MSLANALSWSLMGLTALGVLGSFVVRERRYHLSLVLLAVGFFCLALGSGVRSLHRFERSNDDLAQAVFDLNRADLSSAQRATANQSADWALTDSRDGGWDMAFAGGLLALTALYLLLVVTKPEALLNADGRARLAADKARNGQSKTPTGTGTTA